MTRKDDERQARLAGALRDNLRRRKAQARDAATPVEEAGGAGEPTPPPVTPSSNRP